MPNGSRICDHVTGLIFAPGVRSLIRWPYRRSRSDEETGSGDRGSL